MAERGDGLGAPILVNVEITLIEAGDNALLVVDDRGMQHDFIDLLAKNEDAAVAGIRILGRRRNIRSRIRSNDLSLRGWRRRAARRWRLS